MTDPKTRLAEIRARMALPVLPTFRLESALLNK